MQYQWPFAVAETEVGQALEILANYFERKHAALPSG
jgi:hypothetical protein